LLTFFSSDSRSKDVSKVQIPLEISNPNKRQKQRKLVTILPSLGTSI